MVKSIEMKSFINMLGHMLGKIGHSFIQMDDNARPHRVNVVNDYLEDQGIARIDWPSCSPDLIPIEHLWDYLGREVAALYSPPSSLQDLRTGLQRIWYLLTNQVTDNLIESMERRCLTCIAARGGHTPY